MQRESARQLPIGYWLKHTDEVITRHVDQTLDDRGFTRFRWQVLNTLYEAGLTTRGTVFATMQTFIDADQLNQILDGFARAGWLVTRGEGDATELELIEAGRAERDAVFTLQSDVRRRAMQGISEQEYATVVAVLQRMVSNLE
jgi:DNA-binding MarR family transcriptional regulator